MDGGGILEGEVGVDQTAGLGEEGLLGVGVQIEAEVLRVGADLGDGPVQVLVGIGSGPLGGLALEQVLEGQVHQGASGGRHRRGFGQAVYGREAEG